MTEIYRHLFRASCIMQHHKAPSCASYRRRCCWQLILNSTDLSPNTGCKKIKMQRPDCRWWEGVSCCRSVHSFGSVQVGAQQLSLVVSLGSDQWQLGSGIGARTVQSVWHIQGEGMGTIGQSMFDNWGVVRPVYKTIGAYGDKWCDMEQLVHRPTKQH